MTSTTVLEATREERASRILARTFYRELLGQGFDERQIRAFADEIQEMCRNSGERPTPRLSPVRRSPS